MVSQPAALHLTHASASSIEKKHSGGEFSPSVLVSVRGSLPIWPLSPPPHFSSIRSRFPSSLPATHYPAFPCFPLLLPPNPF